ncbi:MAG TPA: hypothetical protein VGN80_17350 [Devosiaceae bacterium]|nr:hypothetical protein [Devosiaceae bacterium]
MAKASDQFRPSDVTFWGVVALVCCGAAVLSANVAAVVPTGIFAGLHASRADGSTLSQLRAQVVDLAEESVRMRRENNMLLQRFTLAEQARNEVTRRVGALEVSLPELLESQPAKTVIDRSFTASIVEEPTQSFEAEGGSVAVQQKPMLPRTQPAIPVPELSVVAPPATADAYAIALGFPVAEDEAEGRWQELSARVGTLLLGLAPLLQDAGDGAGSRLVAGPLDTSNQADALCGRLDLVGIPCQTVPYTGEPLPLLN